MYRPIIKILLLSFLFFLIPEFTQAGFLDDVACTDSGNCELADIALGFNSLIRLLLGSLGAVALIYFVWGGLQWLVSGGNLERVKNGQQIMINTTWAILLAFGSYMIVSFFVNDVLNVKDEFRIQQGPFITCEGSPQGAVCGENQQCAGVIIDGFVGYSEKCLSTCTSQTLEAANGNPLKVGVCISPLESGYTPVEGAGSDWCPVGSLCAVRSIF